MAQKTLNHSSPWHHNWLPQTKNSKKVMSRVLAGVFCLSAIFTVATTSAVAQDDDKTPAVFKQLEDGVYKYELDNGMRVLFFRRSNAPVFYAQTWVKVGAVDESPEDYGLSNFMEHLAYKGTKNLGTKDSKLENSLREELKGLEGVDHELARARVAVIKAKLRELVVDNELVVLYKKRGAVGLSANANTDYSVFSVELPKNELEFWCWVESDRLMNPVFNEFKSAKVALDKERRGLSTEGPQGVLYHAMASLSSLPRLDRIRAIAWPPDVEEPTVSQARDFYKTFYRPDNIVLSIVGDLDPDDVEDLTDKYFGRMREGDGDIPRLQADGQQQSRSVDIDVESNAKPQVLVGYQKPVWPERSDMHYTVLQSVLGGGRPSMLYRELVSKKRVAKSVFVSEAPTDRAPSTFVVGASPRPGISSDRLLTEIYSILDRTKTTLFDNQTLDSAKRRVRVKMFKDLKSNAGVAELLGKSELLWGDWREMTKMYRTLSRTSARDLRRIARDDFAIDKRITLRLRPARGR